MDVILRENPQYVIVFESPSADNQALLSSVLDVPAMSGPAAEARTTRTILQRQNGVHARMYTRLAVAVANLTPAQVDALRSSPQVRTVARNQRRELPPLILTAPPTGAGDVPAQHNRALEQIGLDPAQQSVTGQHIKVAVIDTGLDLSHPDFAVLPGNTQSFVPEEPDVQDQNGHGTHCAGVIAGRAAPAGGLRYSVAPDAELLIAKVLDQYGRGYDDQILDAIDWAADQGAHILSLSLGSARQAGQPYSDPYERVASTLLTQGVILVAAAGNESQRPALIAPSATRRPALADGRGRVDGRSGGLFQLRRRGRPGPPRSGRAGGGGVSAWLGGGYKRLSGTSMATPHVAGAAALWMQLVPDLSGEALRDKLKLSARPLAAAVSDVGSGVVQVPR